MKVKNYVLVIAALILFNISNAQSSAGALIQGGVEDGEKLLGAYLEPINKAIVFGLSDVTYTGFRKESDTRKFTIGIKLAYIPIPEEDLTYDVSKLNMEYIEAKDPNKTMAQSVFGDSIKTITLASKEKDYRGRPLFEFESPTGGQTNAMPLPALDLGYRMEGTNIAVSFIPPVKVPETDMTVGMIGTSVQQDLAVFIEGLKDKPFTVSLQGSGAFLYGNIDLHVEPDGITAPGTLSGNASGPYDNQEVKINYSSIQIGAYFDYTVAEKYTFFTGTAFNSGKSKVKVLGTYPVAVSDPLGIGSVSLDDIEDPIDISQSFSRMKFELGARADWNRFYLQLNYNIATYGGLGVNLGYKL